MFKEIFQVEEKQYYIEKWINIEKWRVPEIKIIAEIKRLLTICKNYHSLKWIRLKWKT